MKILMVCLGNICRSPLAHGILAQLAREKGLDWTIHSAGTGDWHIGQAPDHRAIQVAKKNGFDISTQRAQQFNPSFFDEYDHILVMDRQNLKNVKALARNSADEAKVTLFIDNDIVPDPYHDDQMFDPVFDLIHSRSLELLEQFKGDY